MVLTTLVDEYLLNLTVGSTFGMRDICQYVYMKTYGTRNPLDSTVGRMVRNWRALNPKYDIICVDHVKALYKKVEKN